ncbi:hypothetical protein BDN70DRAFT_938627 [Pholiota conissans]|uniref:Uncharacterized protein n=1 Tax=Pholiota conissans TaxID=109636 RepID=A0A9P5YMF5_9AGAR|nr:hypothetical protein BDN70DRAFT_938627 [Pholiota conissans]
MEDAQVAKAARIRELENDLESTQTELKSKSESIDTLTATSEALESRIGALETELFVRGQELDHERTQARVRQLAVKDAHTKAQERTRALEDELSSKSLQWTRITNRGSKTDLRDALAVRKDMEDERDGPLVRMHDLADAHEKAQAQNQTLGDALQYAKAKITENSKTIDDLSAASPGLRLRIDTLESDLSKTLPTSKL